MTITEERRHRLYTKMEEVIGTDDAATVMELLPPVGWADVATKHDVDHLRRVVSKDIENSELRVKALVSKEMRTFFITSLTANTTMMALIVSAAKLFG